MTKLGWMLGLTLALGSGAARADENEGPPPHGHRPPDAAFAVCASLKEGDACTVELHDKTVDGKCRKVPPHITEDAGKLFCGPPHPPPPRE